MALHGSLVPQEPRVVTENIHKCLCTPEKHRSGQRLSLGMKTAVGIRETQNSLGGPNTWGDSKPQNVSSGGTRAEANTLRTKG